MDLLNASIPKISWPVTMNTGKGCVLTNAKCLQALQDKENENGNEQKKWAMEAREVDKNKFCFGCFFKVLCFPQCCFFCFLLLLIIQVLFPLRRDSCADDDAEQNDSTVHNKHLMFFAGDNPRNVVRGTSKWNLVIETMLMLRLMLTGAACVCFSVYSDYVGTGREWLMCCCTRLDCTNNDDVDIEKCVFCP